MSIGSFLSMAEKTRFLERMKTNTYIVRELKKIEKPRVYN